MKMKLKRILRVAVTFALVVSMTSGVIEPAKAAAGGNACAAYLPTISVSKFHPGTKLSHLLYITPRLIPFDFDKLQE